MFRRNHRPSQASESQRLWQLQVDSLREMVPSARSVVPDKTMWDVAVSSERYGQLSFRVVLPPTFPERAPEFKLLVQATHPWVAPDLAIVGHPRLARWNVHDSLGSITLEIASEFARNPPVPAGAAPGQQPQQRQPQQHHQQHQPQKPPQQHQQHQQHQQQQHGLEKVPVAPVPDKFDELDALSGEQLEKILVSHEKFRDLLMSLAVVKAGQQVQADMEDAIEKQALLNLEKKEEMDAARAKLEEARREFAAKRKEYDDLALRQQKASQAYSIKATLDALREATSKADTESEALVDNFRDGTTEASAFVRDYKRARVKYHQRAAKRERLQFQIRH